MHQPSGTDTSSLGLNQKEQDNVKTASLTKKLLKSEKHNHGEEGHWCVCERRQKNTSEEYNAKFVHFTYRTSPITNWFGEIFLKLFESVEKLQ